MDIKKMGKLKSSCIPILFNILLLMFSPLYLYLNNVQEVSFSEFFEIFKLFLFCGTLLLIGVSLLVRSLSKGIVFTAIIEVIALNYSFFAKIANFVFPDAEYWHILPVLFFLGILLSIELIHLCSPDTIRTGLKVGCAVLSGLIIINIVMALPGIYNIIRTRSGNAAETGSSSLSGEIAKSEDLPNVYWLLFDEYSSGYVAKEYFGYDNSDFVDYLSDKGFNVASSGQNESHKSATVIGNYMNLDYVGSDSNSQAELAEFKKKPEIFRLAKQAGYQCIGLGTAYNFEVDTDYLLTRRDLAKEGQTMGGENYREIMLKQTLYAPFVETRSDFSREVILNAVDDVITMSKKADDTFVFSYFLCPHEPFLFDENGRNVDSSHYYDWKNKEYYLGQYKYCTKLMQKMVSEIIQNDPDSIIIIQSDHSARAGSDKDLYYKWIPKEDMRTFFNAVYYRGETLDIDGLSGVNTLRTVMGRLLDIELPLVEVPQ